MPSGVRYGAASSAVDGSRPASFAATMRRDSIAAQYVGYCDASSWSPAFSSSVDSV